MVNDALARLEAEFEALHVDFGWPSIAPERLIRASLIQILFPVRVTPEASFQHDTAADCVFLAMTGSYFTGSWARIPRDVRQLFHGIVGRFDRPAEGMGVGC